jgi:hypothetical protein
MSYVFRCRALSKALVLAASVGVQPLAFAGAAGTISGVITDADSGAGVASRVELYSCASTDKYCTGYTGIITQSGFDGRYSIALSGSLAAGNYQLRLPLQGLTDGTSKTTNWQQQIFGVKLVDGSNSIQKNFKRPLCDIQIGGAGSTVVQPAQSNYLHTEPVTNVTDNSLEVDVWATFRGHDQSQPGLIFIQAGADGSSTPQRLVLAPHETRTLTFTIPMDRMDIGASGYVETYAAIPGKPGTPIGYLYGPNISVGK